jgi:hypothetical protein
MGDELVKEQSTEVYVIPQPQDIIAEQEAIIFIQELQKLPTAGSKTCSSYGDERLG